jgi:hypothetical protein
MSDKPQIGIPDDAAYVRFGNLLKELPRQVASVLIDASDPLAEVVRPITIKAWHTALIQAAERGELKGSPLVGGILRGGMGEQVTADSIRSFLELRGFEVVATRPDVPGEMQSRVFQTRKDDLSAVIAQAQERAADPADTSSVWAELQRMADERQVPLLGTDERDIRYTASTGDAKFLTKRALAARLDRARKKKGR